MKISLMGCWVSKQDKKGPLGLFLKKLLENIQKEDFGFDMFKKVKF